MQIEDKIIRVVKVLIVIFLLIIAFVLGIMKGESQVDIKNIQAEMIIKERQLEIKRNKAIQEEKCISLLKELKIPNNCEEVKKIINEFDNNVVFIATILHESNFDRMAVNINKDGSVDRGIFQLNSAYWGNVNGNIDYSIKQAKECLEDNGMNCF